MSRRHRDDVTCPVCELPNSGGPYCDQCGSFLDDWRAGGPLGPGDRAR